MKKLPVILQEIKFNYESINLEVKNGHRKNNIEG